ncbi:uncharacterized protein LOC121632339 [Melanotaenia boesemani]|uniref:uncharacterized protein LOC121632339 n=1 Tax=Melanotaenia boesemani TaxID=1250792 RepID=UPI001C03B6B9|nr:uncharacterized protein LOC121632339 [Melanotaenia boesemani]
MPRKKHLLPNDPRGLGWLPPISAASSSEMEETQDSKDLMLPGRTQNVIKEDVPWSSSLSLPDPGFLHVKIKEEECWTSRIKQQKAAYTKRLLYAVVTAKNEDNEKKPQCIRLHEIKTEDSREAEPPTSCSDTQMETDGRDCGGPEPYRNPYPNNRFQQNNDETELNETEDEYWEESLSDSGPEIEDCDPVQMETREPQSGVNKNLVCCTKKFFTYSESGQQILD